jgi:predicted PurR-regulated permease PerM
LNSARGWLIGAIVAAGAFLVWSVLSGALSALLLLFTAVLFAAGLRPIVDRISKRMPYGAAVGLAFLVVIVSITAVGVVLLQPLGAELVKLVQSLPGYANSLQDQLTTVQRHFENDQMARQLASALAASAGGIASAIGLQLLGSTASVAAAIGNALIILLLAVGWMLSSDDLERFVLTLMPAKTRSDWHGVFTEIASRLSAYVQGVVINGSVVGVVMGASLALLGAPYALLLGFIAAIFQAIPMVGAVISGPVIILVVLATSGWTKMLVALAIFTVVQIVDQNVLSPIIFGQRVQLSFLLIILSTIVGGTLLGIGGAFLAVPAAAVLQVLVLRIVAPAIRRANDAQGTTN